jgi:hypothetical protein
MTQFELGWVVGIIEGEGCMAMLNNPNRTGYAYPSVKVSMTDEDTVRRLHELTGIGAFRPIPRTASTKAHYKDQWTWAVGAESECQALLVQILPHLSERRAEAAWSVLDLIDKRREMRDQKNLLCGNGHPRDEYGYRDHADNQRCRMCNQIQSAAAYARKKQAAGVCP